MNNFADAFFETMSGFTTTGAVLTNIEGVAFCFGEVLLTGLEEWG